MTKLDDKRGSTRGKGGTLYVEGICVGSFCFLMRSVSASESMTGQITVVFGVIKI